MKLARRLAARRIQLTLAVRKAEQEKPQLNYDGLMKELFPIG